jgi:hypothetical protein
MSQPSQTQVRLDEDAQAALDELMDEYAGLLVKEVIARKPVSEAGATVEVSASDLRAVASDRPGPLATLRLIMVLGLLLLLAGAAVLAFELLPDVVHGAVAHVGLGLALIGALAASLAALAIYVVQQVGADAVRRWLERRPLQEPQQSQNREHTSRVS